MTSALAVAHAGLEVLGQPVEHDEPLAARRRDRRDPPVADERVEHLAPVGRLVGVLVARRPGERGAGRPLERRAEHDERAVVAGDDQPGVDEPAERPAGPVDGQPGRRDHGVEVGGAERQRGDDEAAVVVGEQADDRAGVERRLPMRRPRQYPASTSTGPSSSSPSAKRRTLARDPLGEQRHGHLRRVADVRRDEAVRQRPQRVAVRAAARDR